MWILWRMKWWSWMWFKQGQIEVDSRIGCDCDSDCDSGECGDGHAEETNPADILPNPLHPPNNTLPNQSKPIVPTPSLSLL